VVVLIAGLLLSTVFRQQGHEARSLEEDRVVPGVVARPHCGGERSSLIAAFDGDPYDVTLPPTGLGSADDLAAVWDCPGGATRLEFSSGVNIVLDRNTISDPAESWAGLVESNPRIYSIGEVLEVPALLIDPDGDPTDDAEGGVTLVTDGVYVSVGGDGMIPLARLVDTTEALRVASIAS
jgi:hypothetical protein